MEHGADPTEDSYRLLQTFPPSNLATRHRFPAGSRELFVAGQRLGSRHFSQNAIDIDQLATLGALFQPAQSLKSGKLLSHGTGHQLINGNTLLPGQPFGVGAKVIRQTDSDRAHFLEMRAINSAGVTTSTPKPAAGPKSLTLNVTMQPAPAATAASST
jgi:hypothetical protein